MIWIEIQIWTIAAGFQMKIITKEEFSRATKLNKIYMPGLASILMEVMKINEVNKVFQ